MNQFPVRPIRPRAPVSSSSDDINDTRQRSIQDFESYVQSAFTSETITPPSSDRMSFLSNDHEPQSPPPSGELAFVTGATTPMGLNIVNELAKEGRDLFLHDHNAASLHRTKASLLQDKPALSVTTLSGDILAPTFARKLFDALGGRRIQLMIHHAANYPQQQQHSEGAHFKVAKTLVEMLQPRMEDGGVIILIASLGGSLIKNALVDYGAKRKVKGFWSPTVWLLTKNDTASHAVSERCIQLYVRHKAPELTAMGVRIVSVSPGPVELGGYQKGVIPPYEIPAYERDFSGAPLTKMESGANTSSLDSPLVKKLSRPDEVSAVVTFLASERASYITGTDIAVDGGASTQRFSVTKRTATVSINTKMERMASKRIERTQSFQSKVVHRVSVLDRSPKPKPSGEKLSLKQDSGKTLERLGLSEEASKEQQEDNLDDVDANSERHPIEEEESATLHTPVSPLSPASHRPRPRLTRSYSLQSLKSSWGNARGRQDSTTGIIAGGEGRKASSSGGVDFEAAQSRSRSNTSVIAPVQVTDPRESEPRRSNSNQQDVDLVQSAANLARKDTKSGKKSPTAIPGLKLSRGSIRGKWNRYSEQSSAASPLTPPMDISAPLALVTVTKSTPGISPISSK